MIRLTCTAAILASLVVAPATAQTADRPVDRGGRYSMAPVEGGGFARLDTETGTMSICQRHNADWACKDIEDDRQLRQENDRLAKENRQLKDELKRLEDFVVDNGGRGLGPRAEAPGTQFRLPSEEEVDKALGYFERMLKKFRDKMKELEGDKSATPL